MATADVAVLGGPKHYVWWFPGSPVKVHLDFQTVQRLKQRLADVGVGPAGTSDEGFLLGRIRDGATEIIDFQPVTSSNLPSIVAGLSPERRRTLVGYYRTEPGATFCLTGKDKALANECFSKPHQVFLMIHANGFGPPNATFFFRDGDHQMTDVALLEFPLDPALLAIEEHERIQRSHPAAVAKHSNIEQSASPKAATGQQNFFARIDKRRVLRVLAWACCIAVVFSLGMLFNSPSLRARYASVARALFSAPVPIKSSPAASSSLALHAIRQGGDLEVTWNRDSSLMSAATSGVISIQDGALQRQVLLDPAQVRGGSLLYSPTSDQILMQLSVSSASETTTESVMVILPKAGVPRTYPVAPSKPPAASESRPTEDSDAVPLAKASRPFVAPATGKSSPPVGSSLQDPAPLRIVPLAVPSTIADIAFPIPVLPQPPATPQSVAPEKNTYQPPVAIVKVSPVIPASMRNLAGKDTVVQVLVSIDETGKVTKAAAAPGDNSSTLLLNSVISAAKLWKFKPALRNTTPVTSEAVVKVVFHP